jgi:hypothetical protein
MKKTKHGTELISEGCKSYHQALYAVMQFRKQVQEIVRAAVDDHASKLATALAIGEGEMECIDYADPSQFQSAFDGSEAQVGLKCHRGDWTLWYYLWVGDRERAWFGAECWLKNPSAAIAKLSSCNDEDLEVGDDYVLLYSYLPAKGKVDLATICDQVLRRWIKLWTKVGGLQQFLPKRKKKKSTGQ